ncbi:MAG: hypothetical protein U0491_00250 [Candidatus Saccharimonadales bacterium]
MKYRTKKLNQQGLSAILFSMVFAIILSLLAIGFATLVRNDQRQVLDKTLSYQAQYAAETAINRVGAQLRDPNGGLATAQSSCETLDLNDASSSASAKVTCITWTSEVDSIEKTGLSIDPFVTRLKPKNGAFSSVKIVWNSSGSTTTYTGATTSSLPAINSGNISILRIAITDKSNVSGTKVAYLVPNDSQSSLASGFSSGSIGTYSCSSGVCTASVPFSSNDAYLSVIAYGPPANITGISVLGATDNKLTNAQAEIDSNARAQDVTKRIKARVPLVSQTWNPGFALSADSVCKDLQVNGTQNSYASDNTAIGARCY